MFVKNSAAARITAGFVQPTNMRSVQDSDALDRYVGPADTSDRNVGPPDTSDRPKRRTDTSDRGKWAACARE